MCLGCGGVGRWVGLKAAGCSVLYPAWTIHCFLCQTRCQDNTASGFFTANVVLNGPNVVLTWCRPDEGSSSSSSSSTGGEMTHCNCIVFNSKTSFCSNKTHA